MGENSFEYLIGRNCAAVPWGDSMLGPELDLGPLYGGVVLV
jgi:hypothetical protein